MSLGSGPIFTLYVGSAGSVTIAASLLGTAAATQIISSAPFTYARGLEVFNQTGRNLEIFVDRDQGTTAYKNVTIGGNVFAYTGTSTAGGVSAAFFCPGTAASTVTGRVNRFPISLQGGEQMWVRTTENTNITCSAANPLVLVFWA